MRRRPGQPEGAFPSRSNQSYAKQSRHNEQPGVFPGGRDHSGKIEYVRRIMQRHEALQAGLPDPDQIDPIYTNLGDTELPIYAKKREFLSTVRNNRVTILEGDTGSGKTSQAWQYLLGEGYAFTAVLVPRVVIGDNVYDYAHDNLVAQRGTEFADSVIGVAHSERSIRSDDTKVMFMTAGTFVKMYPQIERQFGDKPVAIMSDEIHESDLQVELATAIAAESLEEHDKWRLILSSATQNEAKIQAAMTPVNGKPVPVVSVEGRPHALETVEEPLLSPVEAYLKYRKFPDGKLRESVIIYQPGKVEVSDTIDAVHDALEKEKEASPNEIISAPLHRKISHAAFELIQRGAPEGKQLVVVSTSAGQSGITIPGTSLVISDGLTKRPSLDLEGGEGLNTLDASRDELLQRGGRAGRDVEGGVFVLTRSTSPTGEEYFIPLDEREPFAPAQIYSTRMSRTVLSVAALDREFMRLNSFLLSPAKEDRIVEAKQALYHLNALDQSYQVTALGRNMDKLPFRPEFSRGIVEAWKGGHSLRTIADVTAIASALEAGGLINFEEDSGDEWRGLLRSTTADDIIAQLDLFHATRQYFYGRTVDEEKLATLDIDFKNTLRAHRQWDKSMRNMGFNPETDVTFIPPSPEEEQQIRDLFMAGMIDYVYEKTGTKGRSGEAIYKNIHRIGEGIERTISSRSIIGDDAPNFVIGTPRWYSKISRYKEPVEGENRTVTKKKATPTYILENVWPLLDGSRDLLAKYSDNIISSESKAPVINQAGRLVEPFEKRLGSIVLESLTRPSAIDTTPEGRKLLVESVLADRNNEVQRVLHSLVRDIDDLRAKIPAAEYANYFSNTRFPNRGTIKKWVEQAAEHAQSVGEVNSRLRANMYYEGGYRLATWIEEEKIDEIEERSPSQYIGNDGEVFALSYEKGIPIMNRFRLSRFELLPKWPTLPDGRQIVYRVSGDAQSRGGATLYTYGDLQTMRSSAE